VSACSGNVSYFVAADFDWMNVEIIHKLGKWWSRVTGKRCDENQDYVQAEVPHNGSSTDQEMPCSYKNNSAVRHHCYKNVQPKTPFTYSQPVIFIFVVKFPSQVSSHGYPSLGYFSITLSTHLTWVQSFSSGPPPRRMSNKVSHPYKITGTITVCIISTLGEGVDWMHVAQNRDQWRAVVNTVMNIPVQ
jgi:hypothetical protein